MNANSESTDEYQLMTPFDSNFQSAHFIKSAEKLSQCPLDQGVEVAFAGRSNAGKSTALNTLTNQKKLARTSKTPGRTQLINCFGINVEDRRLIDLPGYGFAKVPYCYEKSLAGTHARLFDESSLFGWCCFSNGYPPPIKRV